MSTKPGCGPSGSLAAAANASSAPAASVSRRSSRTPASSEQRGEEELAHERDIEPVAREEPGRQHGHDEHGEERPDSRSGERSEQQHLARDEADEAERAKVRVAVGEPANGVQRQRLRLREPRVPAREREEQPDHHGRSERERRGGDRGDAPKVRPVSVALDEPGEEQRARAP